MPGSVILIEFQGLSDIGWMKLTSDIGGMKLNIDKVLFVSFRLCMIVTHVDVIMSMML